MIYELSFFSNVLCVLRYTHELTGLNMFNIQSNLFLLVVPLTKEKSTL